MAIKFLNSLNADSGVLYVDADNNRVGIGTTSPAQKLHVDGNIRVGDVNDSIFSNRFFGLGNASVYLSSNSGYPIIFNAGGTEKMRVANSGNVGIGTTSPNEKLHVAGNIRVANSGKLYLWNDHNVNFLDYKEWQTSSTSGMTIENQASGGHIKLVSNGNINLYANNNGNVGIGTTSPSSKLHIEDNTPFLTLRGTDSSYSNAGIQLISGNATNNRALGVFHYVENSDVEWFAGLPYSGNDAYVINRNTGYTVPSSQSSPPGIGASGGRLLTITPSGNVGIGTDNPSYKLQVNGTARFGDGSPYLKVTSSSVEVEGTYLFAAYQSGVSFYAYESVFRGLIKSDGSGGNALKLGDTQERMRIVGGNVGIGTTSPSTKLQVAGTPTTANFTIGDISNSLITVLDTTTPSAVGVGGRIAFGSTYYNQGNTVGQAYIGGYKENAPSNGSNEYYHALVFGTHTSSGVGVTEKMRITSAGKVGIGSTSPIAKLHIRHDDGTYNGTFSKLAITGGNGGNNQIMKVDYTGDAGIMTIGYAGLSNSRIVLNGGSGGTASGFGMYHASTQKVAINANANSYFNGGNVGIGTTSPQQKLHVDGTIRIGADVDLSRYAGQLRTAQNLILGSPNSEGANLTINTDSTKPAIGVRRPPSGTTSILKVRDYSTQDVYVDIDSDGVADFAGKVKTDTGFEAYRTGARRVFLGGTSANGQLLLDNNGTWDVNLTGGSNKYFAQGNFGIGTTSPYWKLEVAATGLSNTDVLSSNTGGIGIKAKNSTQLAALDFGFYDSGTPARNSLPQGRIAAEFTGTGTNFYFIGSKNYNTGLTKNLMTINADGKVGIGTTSPVLGGNTGIDIYDTDYPQLRLHNTTTGTGLTSGFLIGLISGTDVELKNYESGNIVISTSGSERMRLTLDGKLGIGVTNPLAKLHVSSTTGWGGIFERGIKDGATSTYSHSYGAGNAHILGRGLILESSLVLSSSTPDASTVEYRFRHLSNKLILQTVVAGVTTNANVITFDSDNVGIGTDSPGHKLDVSGTIRATENIIATGHVDANQLYVADKILHSGDTDTYLGFDNNNIKLYVGGSQKVELNNDGTLKIGNSTNSTYGLRFQRENSGIPQDSHFYSPGNNSPSAFFIEGGYWTGEATGQVTAANNGYAYYERYFGNGTSNSYKHLGFVRQSSSAFTGTDLSPSIVMLSNGNVGIGTTSPSAKLDVNGGINVTQNSYINWGGGSRIVGSSSYLRLQTSSQDRISITNTGNVGIGTNSPSHKLQVAGNIYANAGQIYIDNGYYLSGGDATSRIYLGNDGSQGVQIFTDSTERMRIADGGNVGIGTTSPQAKLHVYNAGNSFIKIDSDATAPYMAGVEFLRSSVNGGRIYNDGGAVQVKLESYFGYDAANPTRGGFMFKTAPVTSGTLVDAVRIDARGYVGIGTTSPNSTLTVHKDLGAGGTLAEFKNSNSTYSQQMYLSFDSSKTVTWNQGSSSGGTVFNSGTQGIRYQINGSEKLRITGDGNVGIGTTSPTYKLDVAGTGRFTGNVDIYKSNAKLTLESQTSSEQASIDVKNTVLHARWILDGDDLFRVYNQTSAFDAFAIKSSGNVGIGTASPSEKLHVVGDVRIEGDLTVNGSYTQIDTDVNTTEQWNVTNDGTGPAVTINQTGAQDIMDVQDDGTSVFYIEDGGNVGVGNTDPDHLLTLNQKEDAKGIKVYGYDDKSTSTLELHVNSGGNAKLTQTNPGSSGYLQIHAQNYLEFAAASLVYTSSRVRIYDAGQLDFGSGGDYKIKYDSTGDILNIHTDDNKGISIGSTGTLQLNAYTGGYLKTDSSGNVSVDNSVFQSQADADTRYVNVTGDTMTGKLTINSNDFDTHLVLQRGADNLSISPSGGQLLVEGGLSPWGNVSENLGRSDKYWLQAYVYSIQSGGHLQFKSNGDNERMRITSAGNVGIGTTSPSYKLHVDGTIGAKPLNYKFIVGTNQQDSYSVGLMSPSMPLNGYLWHDLFAFDYNYTRSQELSIDGISWDPVSLQRDLFIQKQDQSIEIIGSGEQAVRWTFQGVAWALPDFLNVAFTWASPSNNKTILVETSTDGLNWTTRHTSTASAGISTKTCYLTGYGGDNYMRITIAKATANTDSVRVSSLRLMTSRAGDQGRGMEDHYPYTWDADKTITTGAIRTTSNNINYINGNLGVGTTSPSSKVHLKGELRIERSSNGASSVINMEGNFRFVASTGYAHVFVSNGTEMLRMYDGKVGIGTTTPQQKLSVNGGHFAVASGGRVYIGGANGTDSTIGYLGNDSGVMELMTDGTRDFKIGGGTGGTTMFFDTSAGNVGIGTASPGHKLDVGGSININNISYAYKINDLNVLSVSANYTNLHNSEGAISIYLGDSGDRTNYYDNNFHRFRTAGGLSDYMFINSNGNVGIGTTSPASKLHVYQGGNAELLVEGTNVSRLSLKDPSVKTTIGTYNDGSLRLGAENNAGTTQLVIKNNTVGIGKVPSSAKLDVNGDVKADNFIGGNEAGIYTFNDTVNASVSEDIFSVSCSNGAAAFRVTFVCSTSGMSVAKTYEVVKAYAAEPVFFKVVDTGAYNGNDFDVSFSDVSSTGVKATITNNSTGTNANFVTTVFLGGSPTTITVTAL